LHQRRAEGSDPFLWAEGVPGAKMRRMMSLQYGNSVMSQRFVSEWIERFKNGRTSVKHEEGTGHQSISITDADMERVYGMIPQNRQVTVDEVAHQLKISRGLAYENIHNIKSLHDGSQSNSQNCTKRNIWTSANGF
jgi:ribosomal protein S25